MRDSASHESERYFAFEYVNFFNKYNKNKHMKSHNKFNIHISDTKLNFLDVKVHYKMVVL